MMGSGQVNYKIMLNYNVIIFGRAIALNKTLVIPHHHCCSPLQILTIFPLRLPRFPPKTKTQESHFIKEIYNNLTDAQETSPPVTPG